MNTFFNRLSNTQYSLFRLIAMVVLYVGFLALVYSMMISYVHPQLRVLNLLAFVVLTALVMWFQVRCPKRY